MDKVGIYNCGVKWNSRISYINEIPFQLVHPNIRCHELAHVSISTIDKLTTCNVTVIYKCRVK